MIYEDRVVAFVDILGFKDLIYSSIDENGSEIEAASNRINDFFTEIQREFSSEEKWSDTPDSCTRIVTHFSDSIVFSVKASQKDGILFMLDYIHYLLITGIQYGIIFRGGITYGKVCHTENKIFGPAMNASYLLESKKAIFPRIIIDNAVIVSTFKNRGTQADIEDVKKYLLTIINQDADDYYYIDYFSNVVNEMEYACDKHSYSEQIRNIISKIDNSINSSDNEELKESLRKKNNWLKEKYNELLEEQQSLEYPEDPIDEEGFSELGQYFNTLQPYKIDRPVKKN